MNKKERYSENVKHLTEEDKENDHKLFELVDLTTHVLKTGKQITDGLYLVSSAKQDWLNSDDNNLSRIPIFPSKKEADIWRDGNYSEDLVPRIRYLFWIEKPVNFVISFIVVDCDAKDIRVAFEYLDETLDINNEVFEKISDGFDKIKEFI